MYTSCLYLWKIIKDHPIKIILYMAYIIWRLIEYGLHQAPWSVTFLIMYNFCGYTYFLIKSLSEMHADTFNSWFGKTLFSLPWSASLH